MPQSMKSDRAPAPARRKAVSSFVLADLLAPIRAFRWRYLPLLMVYFAYGALGLIDVTRDMWIKEQPDARVPRSSPGSASG